jgi:hypothetical protein
VPELICQPISQRISVQQGPFGLTMASQQIKDLGADTDRLHKERLPAHEQVLLDRIYWAEKETRW